MNDKQLKKLAAELHGKICIQKSIHIEFGDHMYKKEINALRKKVKQCSRFYGFSSKEMYSDIMPKGLFVIESNEYEAVKEE